MSQNCPNDFLDRGLTSAQAASAKKNVKPKNSTKSVPSIVLSHVFTLFNIINFILAAALWSVGSFKNSLFIFIVLANLIIGLVQELRSKRAVDKLAVVNTAVATVIRDGEKQEISIYDISYGDLLIFTHGRQIPVDCRILSGEIDADESCVTGESDGVKKTEGDMLYAGSYVLSGQAYAVVTAVGEDCYISAVAKEGKRMKRPPSQIMNSINKIILVMSICVVPVGVLTFLVQYGIQSGNITGTVASTAAAVISMIPDGLVLLTSSVLAVSVIRLSSKRVLVKELHCIENLARADVLCLDKTGTLTEGKMSVEQVEILSGDRDTVLRDCAMLLGALPDNNSTYTALLKYFGRRECTPEQVRSFNSKNKWSGARINGKTLVWGAPEYVLPNQDDDFKLKVAKLSEHCRTLVLACGRDEFPEEGLPELEPVGIITIRDVVRPDAKRTLEYFAEQGVAVYVFSGDGRSTVERVALDCGLDGGAIDISGYDKEMLDGVLDEHRLFARVSPLQKQYLVELLKERGHSVAFVGDGVNDVPALKTADCSIAMGNGTDAARGISQLVLLGNNFDSLPSVVAEGRQTINNLQRSAALFLIKTIYASMLAFLFLMIGAQYPFQPIQMSLISTTGTGIPSFILALEPNKERISGTFMGNLLYRCIPGGITVFVGICLVYLARLIVPGVTQDMVSTACVFVTGLAFMINIYFVSKPLNILRGALLGAMCIGFMGAALLFPEFFCITPITGDFIYMVIAIALVEVGLFVGLRRLLAYLKSSGRIRVKP